MKLHMPDDDPDDVELWIEKNPLAPEQIKEGAKRLSTILLALADGIPIKFEDELYPFGMSINGSVGSIYAGRVVGDLEIHFLIQKLCKLSEYEWAVIATNIALNRIKRSQANHHE